MESFNLDESAQALGRTAQTIRRWQQLDLIPTPFLKDLGGTMVYSKGELEVIARVLAQHSKEFQNLCSNHDHVRHTMHQLMHAYRVQHL